MKARAKANVNIALIKYWGKKDKTFNLPLTSSISMTLDRFYTITAVNYDRSLKNDELFIDDKLILGTEYLRVKNFMDKIRKIYNIPYYAKIESKNFVPKKAGIASSASAFAALALAATKAYGLDLSKKELSTIARLGSGSASRSIFGNLVKWNEGNSHETSYAEEYHEFKDLVILVCLVDQKEKKIDSRTAMNLLEDQKELKDTWIKITNDYLNEIDKAFINKDLENIGLISEKHALLMHELIEKTGVTYLTDKSKEIIKLVLNLRKQGQMVFASADAGPNIKVITTKQYLRKVLPLFEKITDVVLCSQGVGVELV